MMQEQEGEGEPAHHARRPMNAFLIFCKRHRSVVRDKYPNLENRSITKILGEWWANLDKEEKACYTSLAKQYKDAFFSANPDFKWYKLPAPPLRTLGARVRDHDKQTDTHTDLYHVKELEKTNNNSTKVDFNKKGENYVPKPLSMFTPGKLADEAQMGGISRLLDNKTENQTPDYYSASFNAISTPRSHHIDRPASREDSIRELQNALSETTKIFEHDFDVHTKPYANDLTNQDVIDQVVNDRYSKDEDIYQRHWSDEDRAKSGRSCKGKRYQEFMAVGGLIINKRQKRDHDKGTEDEYGYNASSSWDPGSRSEESTLTDDSKTDNSHELRTDVSLDTTEPTDPNEPDNNANKTFKAADFDLDAKIAALPSLSLEKFQQKKRDNKRRKKTINLKPKMIEPQIPIVNSVPNYYAEQRREMVESWTETVTGSQKRKPRKISITRFEGNSFASSMGNAAHKVSPEIKLATEAPCNVVPNMDMCGMDLLALATLAEVASNTSKIEGATIMGNLTAKAGGNASTV